MRRGGGGGVVVVVVVAVCGGDPVGVTWTRSRGWGRHEADPEHVVAAGPVLLCGFS